MGLDNWLGHGDKEFQFLNLPEKIETEAAKAWAQAGRREQQLLAAEAKSHKAEADLATYRCDAGCRDAERQRRRTWPLALWLAPLMSYGTRVSLRLRLWAPAQ